MTLPFTFGELFPRPKSIADSPPFVPYTEIRSGSLTPTVPPPSKTRSWVRMVMPLSRITFSFGAAFMMTAVVPMERKAMSWKAVYVPPLM